MATREKELYSWYSEILPPQLSRTQQRTLEITEAAIQNYASVGVDQTTYETIAKTCKISRPLILRYFKDKKAIFEFAVKYIRANFQNLALEAIRKQSDPRRQLEAYVRSTFDWVERYPAHAKVWALYFYYCAIDPKLRSLNTEMVDLGHERITALLEGGKKAGLFACADPRATARVIQVAITGALVSFGTEKRDRASLEPDMVRTSLLLAQARAE